MPMTPELAAYLQRIGYEGQPQPDLATLVALHRAHLLAIPYENLDIHCGRSISINEADFFPKLVTAKRGGWCYEMNGLLAHMLRTIGFDVRLLATTVGRQATSKIEGDHLVLMVLLDRPYLVDVGFGNGIFEPIPLANGRYQQRSLEYGLRRDNEPRWWFDNQKYGGVGFDFTLEEHQLEDFAAQSHALQTLPESGFVRTTVCHRFTPEGYTTLKGAILSTITAAGRAEHIVTSQSEYENVLVNTFDLRLPADDITTLWGKVWQRHQAWVAEQQA